jgi:hypothetical protein
VGKQTMDQHCLKLNISCHYLHFTSIEDIYLKSSILGLSSILRVSGRKPQGLYIGKPFQWVRLWLKRASNKVKRVVVPKEDTHLRLTLSL